MSIVISLLQAYGIWLYALFGIIALFALRSVLKARAEIKQSIFSLEKEVARNRVYRGLSVIVFMCVLSGGVFAVTNYVEPQSLPAPIGQTPTSTPLLRATPTPSESEYTPTPTPQPTLVRPTRQPLPTAVVETPTATAVPPPHCSTPGVNLTAPGEGAQLSGSVQVMGTASIDNFWYYKIEIGVGRAASDWSVVGDLHYAPVSNGVLETVNTSALPPGEYSLRLVVVDKTGNFPEPCVVHVTFVR
jgi:hypothetical protein